MKILLLGYMGSGKSTISKKLAHDLGFSFFDLDQLIEKNENASIANIFDDKGEIYFRKVESKILREFVTNNSNFVLALGGGTPCYANNHEVFAEKDVLSIYLKGSIATLFQRLLLDRKDRPLLANLSTAELEDYIRKHLFDRSYYYLKAQHIINIDDKTVTDICNEIQDKLR